MDIVAGPIKLSDAISATALLLAFGGTLCTLIISVKTSALQQQTTRDLRRLDALAQELSVLRAAWEELHQFDVVTITTLWEEPMSSEEYYNIIKDRHDIICNKADKVVGLYMRLEPELDVDLKEKVAAKIKEYDNICGSFQKDLLSPNPEQQHPNHLFKMRNEQARLAQPVMISIRAVVLEQISRHSHELRKVGVGGNKKARHSWWN